MPSSAGRRRTALRIGAMLGALAFTTASMAVQAADADSPIDTCGELVASGAVSLDALCRVNADGLFEITGLDGETSLLHGPDLVFEPDDQDLEVAAASTATPLCSSDANRVTVLYARLSGRADNRGTYTSTMRAQVRSANQMLHDRHVATGGPGANLRVRCASGSIRIATVTVANTSFDAFRDAARNAGYTQSGGRFVAFADYSVSGIGGIGTVGTERTKSTSNSINRTAHYSLVYRTGSDPAPWSAKTLLHELSHNMGAVNTAAPYANGKFHCNDGKDVMCYPEAGATGTYTETRCAAVTYDCGGDTYFDGKHETSEYLANNWNLGGVENLTIKVTGVPDNRAPDPGFTVSCSLVTCTFNGRTSDPDGDSVTHSWSLPGSTTSTGSNQEDAEATYLLPGTYTATHRVTDSRGLSATATRTFTVGLVEAAQVISAR